MDLNINEELIKTQNFKKTIKKYSEKEIKSEILKTYDNKEKRELIDLFIEQIEILWNRENFDHQISIDFQPMFPMRRQIFWMKEKEDFLSFYDEFTDEENRIAEKIKSNFYDPKVGNFGK